MGEEVDECAGDLPRRQAAARNAAFTTCLLITCPMVTLKREKCVQTYIQVVDETYKCLDICMDILRIQSIHGKFNYFSYFLKINIILNCNNCKPKPKNSSTCLTPTLCKENSVLIALAVRAFFHCRHSQPNTRLIYSLSSRDCKDQ